MEEKGVPKSCLIMSEVKDDRLSAMYFGVSCALLVWRVQNELKSSCEKHQLLKKLETAEREICSLKKQRSEDAKANEKVASIYAAQEQTWFAERRRLQIQIRSLSNDLKILNKQKNDMVSEWNAKLLQMELSVKSKDKMLEEEAKKRTEVEEKLKCLEASLEELRETAKREAQDHSSELLKHKTAFIELVSNQRHLEAELGRALRQVEASKSQLEFVFEEKEAAVLMVRKLSLKIQKMKMESENKDQILSAVMRKLKLDSQEQHKLSKPKRRSFGSRNGCHTLRNMLARQVSSRYDFSTNETEGNSFEMGLSEIDNDKARAEDNKNDAFDDLVGKVLKQHQECPAHLGPSFPQQSTEFDKAARLDEWLHSEAEKYHHAVEQQHQLELDAFAEKMQSKEDKLEAYRWKLRSAELESKRLQSQIEGLNQDMSFLRHSNLKLENLLLDREVELRVLKGQIALQLNKLSAQTIKLQMSTKPENMLTDEAIWSKVKKEQFAKKEEEPESVSLDSSPSGTSSIEEPACEESATNAKEEEEAKVCSDKQDKSPLKVDLHALGVSYKIKRLSQQLLMLDRLTGKQEDSELNGSNEHGLMKTKGFLLLISLLNKQVSRYQSLQEKADSLSHRMGEKDLYVKQGATGSGRSKEETKALEQFLDETFQLQRFIVATGQKLMEIQSKLASGFSGISEELNGSTSFDMKRFADTIQSLFKDVQSGLEVRIARIIGDLEGTLACDGIHALR